MTPTVVTAVGRAEKTVEGRGGDTYQFGEECIKEFVEIISQQWTGRARNMEPDGWMRDILDSVLQGLREEAGCED